MTALNAKKIITEKQTEMLQDADTKQNILPDIAVAKKSKKQNPSSFMLYEKDLINLANITKEVNKISNSKISKAAVVRAVLVEIAKMKAEKIYKLIQKSY